MSFAKAGNSCNCYPFIGHQEACHHVNYDLNLTLRFSLFLDLERSKQKFWRRKWQPTPVHLPGEAHGERNLAGYSPRGSTDSDRTATSHSRTLERGPATGEERKLLAEGSDKIRGFWSFLPSVYLTITQLLTPCLCYGPCLPPSIHLPSLLIFLSPPASPVSFFCLPSPTPPSLSFLCLKNVIYH